ncbi:hypothetical protein DBV05_g11823 [Lasiodiplodia theobromae]|uniref:Uncharacterized protein n=1 Tax=Lasiodiplodia theobromae TaxID=45133 RepID=A0A5N5CVX8_9PEZI|nr:hypothetical protein DBV05_g11823 [Lasiodiplodia theobromae]
MSSSSPVIPDWLAKQSTTGTSRTNLPPLPEDGYDLGFPLPDAPTTAQEAIALVQALRSDGSLPDSTHYNEEIQRACAKTA